VVGAVLCFASHNVYIDILRDGERGFYLICVQRIDLMETEFCCLF